MTAVLLGVVRAGDYVFAKLVRSDHGIVCGRDRISPLPRVHSRKEEC